MRSASVVLAWVAACSGGAANKPDAARDATPVDVPIDAHLTVLPVAPTSTDFMWPSLQEKLLRSDGVACAGQITLAVGDQAVCYVAAGGELRCAGSIYTHAYGTSFTATGQTGVDQIAISATFNAANGNNICIHKTDHTMSCMGANTPYGALGTGDTNPSATFVQWQVTGVARITGWTDTNCALDAGGHIWCAGYNHTATPTMIADAGGHHSVYIDDTGTMQLDSTTVFRASDGYVCQVEADGLHCNAPMTQLVSGAAGDVVDGTAVSAPGGPAMGDYPACSLDSKGAVHCSVSGITAQLFQSAPPILAIAGTFYGDSLCAVGNDGSLWCKGTNAHGELGTGNMTALTAETQVQPPGSIDVSCR